MQRVPGQGLHAYVPHSFEVVNIAPVGAACFIATRPTAPGIQGFRDTLILADGLSASWADVTRDHALEEHYDCSGALKIHLRVAGRSGVTDGGQPAHDVAALSCSALAQPRGARKIEIFRGGERERSVTVSCSRNYLIDELGIDAQRYDGALRHFLDGEPLGFTLFRTTLGDALLQAAQTYFEPCSNVFSRRLRLQSCTHDIVRVFFERMGGQASVPPSVSLRDRETVARVIARLAHGEGSRPRSVKQLAAQAGMSESKFTRTFKAVQGSTTTAYLQQLRMERAMVMIRSGRLPITQIALEVGYDHPANFSTAFRRHFGVAPRDVC